MWQKTIKIPPSCFSIRIQLFCSLLVFLFPTLELSSAFWNTQSFVSLLLELAYFDTDVVQLKSLVSDCNLLSISCRRWLIEPFVSHTHTKKRQYVNDNRKNWTSLKTINEMMFFPLVCEGEQAIHWWLVLLLLFQPRICLLLVNGTLWAIHGFFSSSIDVLPCYKSISNGKIGNWYPNHNQNWWFSKRNNWFISQKEETEPKFIANEEHNSHKPLGVRIVNFHFPVKCLLHTKSREVNCQRTM